MPAGYSGTSLAKKLGVKTAQRTWRSRMPASIAEEIDREGFAPQLLSRPSAGLEMAHIFVTDRRDLARELHRLRHLLTPEGVLWASWPKKSSKRATDITEDVIRAEALPLGYVDTKVCAVDEIWSGLKLVIRKSER